MTAVLNLSARLAALEARVGPLAALREDRAATAEHLARLDAKIQAGEEAESLLLSVEALLLPLLDGEPETVAATLTVEPRADLPEREMEAAKPESGDADQPPPADSAADQEEEEDDEQSPAWPQGSAEEAVKEYVLAQRPLASFSASEIAAATDFQEATVKNFYGTWRKAGSLSASREQASRACRCATFARRRARLHPPRPPPRCPPSPPPIRRPPRQRPCHPFQPGCPRTSAACLTPCATFRTV